MLEGDVTVPAAADARGLMKGGLSEPVIGESIDVKAGSYSEEVEILGPSPEIVFLLASEPENG